MTGARNSTRLNYVPMGPVASVRKFPALHLTLCAEGDRAHAGMSPHPVGEARETPQRWRIFCSRLRRRIRFLRHFQRILPRFFHARELRFMG
jgi:hypothetical protein